MVIPALSQRRPGNAPRSLALVALAVVALSGCAQQQARVTGTAWADGAQRHTYSRVLVLGVSPNVDGRCAFEYFLASRINTDGTAGITSCSAVTKKDPLTRESIEQAVAATHADAVLATILVARNPGAKSGGERDTRGGAYYKATGSGWADGYWGMYGVPVIYADFQALPPITTIQGDVEVESKLYDVRDAKLVYTVTTRARKFEGKDEGLALITTPIADRLRKDGLIR